MVEGNEAGFLAGKLRLGSDYAVAVVFVHQFGGIVRVFIGDLVERFVELRQDFIISLVSHPVKRVRAFLADHFQICGKSQGPAGHQIDLPVLQILFHILIGFVENRDKGKAVLFCVFNEKCSLVTVFKQADAPVVHCLEIVVIDVIVTKPGINDRLLDTAGNIRKVVYLLPLRRLLRSAKEIDVMLLDSFQQVRPCVIDIFICPSRVFRDVGEEFDAKAGIVSVLILLDKRAVIHIADPDRPFGGSSRSPGGIRSIGIGSARGDGSNGRSGGIRSSGSCGQRKHRNRKEYHKEAQYRYGSSGF